MRVLKLLLCDDATKEDNVSTIAIYGIGGLGKTTLAQLVFNDAEVKNHFELSLWVCVSEVFDLRQIVCNIIKSATSTSPDQNLALDQLQNRLRQEIDGKRYLLVLDDVWNEDREKWSGLESLLKGGARGSRVLVTTRNEMVAGITHSFDDQPLLLSELEKEKSWSLFSKMAFKRPEDLTNPEIVGLGKAILEKCKGVPLAIKTIGGILYFKNPKTDWLSFKDKELSRVCEEQGDGGILATLKLSYNHLPSHLKRCFAYCSLFPKDYVFKVQTLIHLWMAQGFIKADQNQCSEDIGYEYFLDLLWRSFFHEAEEDEWRSRIESCKMHDLMHDLAVSISGNCSVLIYKGGLDFGRNLIHVSFSSSLEDTYLKGLSSLDRYKLRTFMSFSNPCDLGVEKRNSITICSKFNLLRSLMFGRRYSNIEKLPNSLGELKHLRYLEISYFDEIRELPNSIAQLQNLHTLNLSGCESLLSLTEDMYKMVSLRHLVLSGCSNLTHMPSRIGELTCLQTMNRFVVGSNLCNICYANCKHTSMGMLGELRNLNSLRGDLYIDKLRADMEESENPKLQDKQHLQDLTIDCWNPYDYNRIVAVDKYEKSLEMLVPHPNLKKLQIFGYMGVRLASWVTSLVNLRHLTIGHCYNLNSLPEAIGNLSSLQSFKLLSCTNLNSLPEAIGNLSSLQSFVIYDCDSLNSLPEAISNLSSLIHLMIKNCTKLNSLPEAITNLSSLQTLRIQLCPILDQRYNKESGKDWPKIAHIPEVDFLDVRL